MNDLSTDNTVKEPGRSGFYDLLAWGLFLLTVLFFLVLKSFSFHWQTGDENVYFYSAWVAAEYGVLPYADYFFSHPPFHLLPGILLFACAGFGPVTARLIPICATLVGAFFLFHLARKSFGRIGAVATVLFYLTSFSLLRASTHWTGINLSVMWIVIALWALFGKRPLLAGVCMAFGVCTGTYVLPGAIMAGLLAFLQSNRCGVRYWIGFVGLWGAVQLSCWWLGGEAYLDAVYRYHMLKPIKAGVSWSMSVRVFTDNFTLFLGTVLALILASLISRETGPTTEPSPETKAGPLVLRLWSFFQARLIQTPKICLARIGALWVLGYLLFIAMLPTVFPYYFLLLFPAMALCAGFVADSLISHGVMLAQGGRNRTKAWWDTATALGLIVVLIWGAYGVRQPVQRRLLPGYVRKVDVSMKWSGAPLPEGVNRLVRRVFWDDVAQAYQEYGTVQEVLYHESRYFEQAEKLAEYVRTHSQPEQTIFGDSSVAGLVALLADRRLAGDISDTNTMRFRSGITSANEMINTIDTSQLAFLVVSGKTYKDHGKEKLRLSRFAGVPAFSNWIDRDFQVAFRIHDRTKGWFFLLEKKKI